MQMLPTVDSDLDRYDRPFLQPGNVFTGAFPPETPAGGAVWINRMTVDAGVVTAASWRPRQTFSTDRRGR